MKFKNMPSANETRASGESILKTAREMWADDRIESGKGYVFRKGFGAFYVATTFIVGYSCLGIAWMQRYLERAVLFVIRFLFTLISVVISIPFLSIALFVNVKTGEITKLGKLVSKKYEKNSDKT